MEGEGGTLQYPPLDEGDESSKINILLWAWGRAGSEAELRESD